MNKKLNKIFGLSSTEKELAKLLRLTKGQRIRNFTLQKGVDQYFHLVTDQLDLRFGANDLGSWVDRVKKNLK